MPLDFSVGTSTISNALFRPIHYIALLVWQNQTNNCIFTSRSQIHRILKLRSTSCLWRQTKRNWRWRKSSKLKISKSHNEIRKKRYTNSIFSQNRRGSENSINCILKLRPGTEQSWLSSKINLKVGKCSERCSYHAFYSINSLCPVRLAAPLADPPSLPIAVST